MAPQKKERHDRDPPPASPSEPMEAFTHHLNGDEGGSDSGEGGASDFILKPISPSKPSAKKKKNEIAAAAEADEVKKGRIWSDYDEAAVLRGMIRFKSNNGGADPRKDPAAFHEFVKPSLQLEASEKQLLEKIKKLKQKFYSKLKVVPDDDDVSDHKRMCIDLANQIWGPSPPAASSRAEEEDDGDESGNVAAAPPARRRSKKKKKNKSVAVEVDEESKDAHILEENISGGEMFPSAEEDGPGNSKNEKMKKKAKEKKGKEKETGDVKGRQEESSAKEVISTQKEHAGGNRKIKKLKKRKRGEIVEVEKAKENEEEDKETPGDEKAAEEELSFKVEDFWRRHPNLKESMETGVFSSMVSVGEWLSSTSVGIEKAKELEQKWKRLHKAELELFDKSLELIGEEIGGILSKAADS